MNKGKSVYTFQFQCAPEHVDAVIKGWLNANKFTFQNKYGEDLYYNYDAWNGNRGFQYTISGNVVTVWAWTIGMGKQFYQLDSGAMNNMAGDSYKQMLSSLFAGISNLGADPAEPVQQPSQAQTQTVNEVVSGMNEELDKKAETGCEIGFWLSIVGLLASFGGIIYGIFVYVIIFYLASRGLNTKKRGKAIAAIVMSILSILICVASMFINA